MRFCLIFGAFLRELILSCGIAVLQNQAICGIQKISGNFTEVGGFLILLCAVFVRISVRFCADSHAPSPPLRTPLLSLKFTLLNHNFKVQCNSNYLFFTNMLWYQSCFPTHFEQSLQTAVSKLFSVYPHILVFFFCKARTDN